MESSELSLLSRELANIKHALDQSAIVATTDRAGSITYVNDKFCEISKYSREELLGQNHRLINSCYHSREFWVEMWKTISSGKTWSGEIRNRAKNGKIYWVNTTIVPFLDEKGVPFQYVSIRFEITQRKEAEQKLAHYASRLENSNRELQDFASIAAHDLQEPLRKIQAFSDRIQTKFRDLLPVEATDYLNRMQSAAGRMQTLINDLLTYSRVTTKAQPFKRVDLKTIVSGVLTDLEVRIEQTSARVQIGELPAIEADEIQMRQLFQNLIGNALKFHHQGSPPEVFVSSQILRGPNHEEYCQIQVSDQGIGFDEKYLTRIFTIFQRLHGRSEYEGTGVGLAVCRRIVERHGGEITARSASGKGATFIITLPMRPHRHEEESAI